ncbi:virulence effector protein [Citrobacter koseri]|nr:virulence effector protein [Citrobacter koseri]
MPRNRQEASIGLYGHSQSSKAHLLGALCGNGEGKLNIATPDRCFDYFTHINPGHAPANMAIRFTQDESAAVDSEWPLRLRLISEAELVQLFITWASASPDNRQVEKSIIETRLEKWQALRQRQPVQGVTGRGRRRHCPFLAHLRFLSGNSKSTMRSGISSPPCCPRWI